MHHFRLYLGAAVVGGLAGLAGAAFHYLLDGAAAGRELLRGAMMDATPFVGLAVLMGLGAFMVVLALWLVRRFAPEAAGSGIQEIEGTLAGERRMCWWRVLPVKFAAGLVAIASGLVLGREGPTIHMGGALGRAFADGARLSLHHTKALMAAGAGAGLAAAFNAPIAGIIFVTEEMREEFEYTFATLQSVILASCMAVVVNDWWLGQGPYLSVADVPLAPLHELPLFLALGVFFGAFGVLFNHILLRSVGFFAGLHGVSLFLAAVLVGAVLGALLWYMPDAVGGGEPLVEDLVIRDWTLPFLLALLLIRTVTTVGSYGTGVPGGIFAPMLALGTIAGIAMGLIIEMAIPDVVSTPGMFAVAGMGALFAATVRAPLTGIVLVLELTGAYDTALTIIVTCLAATFTAQALGGRPIYRMLLERVLHASDAARRS